MITQLGIRISVSFLIWILIALWLKKVFVFGNFIMVVGIFLGLGSAILSFYDFYKKANTFTKKEEDNEH